MPLFISEAKILSPKLFFVFVATELYNNGILLMCANQVCVILATCASVVHTTHAKSPSLLPVCAGLLFLIIFRLAVINTQPHA